MWANEIRLLKLSGYHVIFFYLFGLFAIGFFVTNVVCHASSLYYLNPYVSVYRSPALRLFYSSKPIGFQGRRSYYIKIVFTVLYIISVPILLGAFLLYWKKCITYSECCSQLNQPEEMV